jgi:uncharacterized protein YciI
MLNTIILPTSLAALALGFVAALATPGQEKKPAGSPPPGAPPAHAAKGGEMPQGIRAWLIQLETGPKFDPKTPVMSLPGFEEHAKRMHAMADEGTCLLGGPIFESADSEKITGGIVILKGKDEKEIREKLGSDPFFNSGVMKVASVHPMMIGVGAWMPKEKAAPAGGH